MSGRAAPAGPSGYERTFPATPACVKEGREAVVEAIAGLGLDERVLDDVRLCVSEAMTNAVRHAYGTEGGPVDVSVSPKEQVPSSSCATSEPGSSRPPEAATAASGSRSSPRSRTSTR